MARDTGTTSSSGRLDGCMSSDAAALWVAVPTVVGEPGTSSRGDEISLRGSREVRFASAPGAGGRRRRVQLSSGRRLRITTGTRCRGGFHVKHAAGHPRGASLRRSPSRHPAQGGRFPGCGELQLAASVATGGENCSWPLSQGCPGGVVPAGVPRHGRLVGAFGRGGPGASLIWCGVTWACPARSALGGASRAQECVPCAGSPADVSRETRPIDVGVGGNGSSCAAPLGPRGKLWALTAT